MELFQIPHSSWIQACGWYPSLATFSMSHHTFAPQAAAEHIHTSPVSTMHLHMSKKWGLERILQAPALTPRYVACGGAHCLLVTVAGVVLSWGRGSRGQLGVCLYYTHGCFSESNCFSLVAAAAWGLGRPLGAVPCGVPAWQPARRLRSW